jgi:hypothetical protein
MKTIDDYIDDIDPGQVVPAIKGEVVQITPPKDGEATQVVTIQSEQRIKLYIKKEDLHIPDTSVGSVLSAACSKSHSGISGIILKRNSADKPYLVVSNGATVSVSEPVREEAVSVTEEPMTATDLKIRAYLEDRLYIHSIVVKMIREHNLKQDDLIDHFPIEKSAELATGVHMFIGSGGGGRIAPTHTQRVRKELHKPSVTEKPKKKKEEASEEEADKSDKIDWRDYKHPKSGERIGDISVEKIKTQIAPWYYRANPESLQPEVAEYHYYIGKAIQGHKLTPLSILNAYIEHYAKDVHPHSAALRTESVVRFCNGLSENKILAGNILDDYNPKMNEFLAVIRDFKNLWETLVESDSSDD